MSRMNILVEAYSNIQEMPEEIRTTASMVPVIECNGHYVTESNYIIPFMRENGIDTVEEALDKIAEANNLAKKSVGLVIASQDGINSLSESVIDEATEDKLEGFLRMADRLLEGGYPVFKKRSVFSEDAHGPNCHCQECERARKECGDGSGSSGFDDDDKDMSAASFGSDE